jgi:predicted O-methyltransferase YrrM
MSKGTIGLGKELNEYLVVNQPPEHPMLKELRETTAKLRSAFLQVAPEQGHFLAFLARLVGARNALEIGTYTGYSALAVALVLPPDGRLVTCDINKEWTAIARHYWNKAGVGDKVELKLGRASDALAALRQQGSDGQFDFVFIDADKTGYDGYYESALALVRPGGLIVFDNMLRDGDVADPRVTDEDVTAIRALNAKIAKDERVDRVLAPVGDGMTLVRRR